MDNVLHMCNNGCGGNDNDESSNLGGGCSDGDDEGEDDSDRGDGIGNGGNGGKDNSGDSSGDGKFASITKLRL